MPPKNEGAYPSLNVSDNFESEKEEYLIYLPQQSQNWLENSESYLLHCVYADYADWEGIELIFPDGSKRKIIPLVDVYDRINGIAVSPPLYLYSN